MSEGGGGSGSGINSVIEAEFRARELGGPKYPDAVQDDAELMARRAGWIVGAIGVIGAAWWMAGIGAAAVLAVIAFGGLAAWLIVMRRRAVKPAEPADIAP